MEFPHVRELWIPAFAGMTDGMDSCPCGNDDDADLLAQDLPRGFITALPCELFSHRNVSQGTGHENHGL